MKRYCLDTSGFSNPLELMPEDIHTSLWRRLEELVCAGCLAVNTEIYEELERLQGAIGQCICANKESLVLEIEQEDWDWPSYLAHVDRMRAQHRQYISDYTGGRKGTVGLNDVSIIALGKALELPVVSMEVFIVDQNSRNRRIPNVCQMESVEHLSFNQFLRREGIVGL